MDRKGSKYGNVRADRSKKRKFTGNRHTHEQDRSQTSASARKLSKNNPEFEVNVDSVLQYHIVNFDMFLTLQNILICKTCKSDIKFLKRAEKGLGFQLVVQCKCETETRIPNSPQINSAYEINRRLIFAMRLLGVGFQGVSNFCGFMDIAAGFSTRTYYDIIQNIYIAAKSVVELVFQKAVEEEKLKNEEAGNVKNRLTVSGDGSWPRRGFSSLVGLATLIGKYTGKVLDVDVKSSVCQGCSKWNGKENTIEYEMWHEDHQETCSINHSGSAGLMEVNAIIEMFKRSVSLYNVYYENYVGDGDTKTFKQLKDVDPYEKVVIVKKKECVLHVKKRLFKRAKDAKNELTRLKKTKKKLEEDQNKKSSSTWKKTAAKKRNGEKTALFTNKVMKEMSTYYELAVRRNPNSVENMRKAIWATFFHKISTDSNPQHDNCPEGADSWCKYRVAEANGNLDTFKHPPALQDEIQPLLRKVYEDLTTDDLLERCTGAHTQNTNESYNSCVWRIVPKHVFAGKKVVEIAAFCAVCTFNKGLQPLLKIMETMGVTIGRNAADVVKRRDEHRIQHSNRRSLEASKEHRSELRLQRAAENEAYEEEEGLMYGAGIAD